MRGFRVLWMLLLLASCAPALERGDWEEEPYKALCALLRDRSLRGGYAVFDCDNTTILHDVTHTLMLYQIEHLAFADTARSRFLQGLPETDFPLDGLGLTAGQMGERLSLQYGNLKSLLDDGMSLEEVHQEEEYLDFRAGFLAFYKAIGRNYPYGVLCLWEPMLLSGMPCDTALESLRYWLAQGRVWNEHWTSPDGRFQGTAEKGLVVSQDMKNLYRALRRRGITPYICSASPEWLVEALACDPENGLGLHPEEVFGVRFSGGQYDETYVQPFQEGKVSCIDSLIAPRHGGLPPVLVAGDSAGDVAMLTAYPGMRVGLVMDQHRGGEIGRLAGRKDGIFVAQNVMIDEE